MIDAAALALLRERADSIAHAQVLRRFSNASTRSNARP